ncbi:hypothetical protein PSTT_05654 [Puccinia striiformis]|uniref:Integrase catalytic domain-containing protein n=1 Tax=Puccinia striiformis TaxID=27350 RepID=A0A2S4VN49_9BASI|nr:hypothetical protein PSTT_05654 [Puccinia striiformis]
MIRSDVTPVTPTGRVSILFSQASANRSSSSSVLPNNSRPPSSVSLSASTVLGSPISAVSSPHTSWSSPASSNLTFWTSQPAGNEISMLTSKAKTTTSDVVFREPLGHASDYQWKPEALTKDEVIGHASLRHIRRIIKLQLGNGLPDDLPVGKIHCPVCAISKSTQVNPLAPTLRKIELMDVMAADLIGPFQVNSIEGGKYLLTMRDVATGYAFAKVLKHKSDANGHIINIITRLKQVTGKRVGTLRSDNGGEFANQVLVDFLASR